MGDQPAATGQTLWQRLKRHFIESFSTEMVAMSRVERGEGHDEWQDRRRANAYRYILLLITAAVLPLAMYHIYIREWWSGFGTVLLLALLLANTFFLATGRRAPVSPRIVMALACAVAVLYLYRGQEFGLFLLFPLYAGLPVMMRKRWALVLAGVTALAAAPALMPKFDAIGAFCVVLSLALTWVISAWQMFSLTEQARRYKDLAVTDPLTGAFNRRYLELRAARALASWDRYRRPVSLLILDVDHFKRINDEFGHAVGDQALKALVRVVSERTRSVDTLFRLGGEEFVLLLNETTAARAEKLADMIRDRVATASILPSGHMTVSIGVCEAALARSVEHWLELADGAMYLAKKQGRNRVMVATGQPVDAAPLPKTIPDWR